MITGGGILILVIIGFVIIGIVFINAWVKGASINLGGIRKLKNLRVKDAKKVFQKQSDDGTILCLNISEDEIRATSMLEKSVCKNTDYWMLGGKSHLLQGVTGNQYVRLALPEEVSFPPERLARMMGCEPYRRLKSLKFDWYQKLAPFAPVVAIVIGWLLWITVL